MHHRIDVMKITKVVCAVLFFFFCSPPKSPASIIVASNYILPPMWSAWPVGTNTDYPPWGAYDSEADEISFIGSGAYNLTRLTTLMGEYIGTPDPNHFRLAIVTSGSDGLPSDNVLWQAPPTGVGAYTNYSFDLNFTVDASQDYWLMFEVTTNDAGSYLWGANPYDVRGVVAYRSDTIDQTTGLREEGQWEVNTQMPFPALYVIEGEPVPEPSGAVLGGLGLASLAVMRRFQRNRD